MKATKNRTHLTPEEVQEFINLGVDFGETADVWLLSTGSEVMMRYTRDEGEYLSKFPKCYTSLLPAPNLQEVLEIIPNTLELSTGDESHPYAVVSFQLCKTEDEECSCFAAYHHQSWDFDDDTLHEDNNPLIAAANLLRWVCKNHPETLTKTE